MRTRRSPSMKQNTVKEAGTMEREPAEYQSLRSGGYHDCGARYGWCGEHRAFSVTYRCPGCESQVTLGQCAAWPVTATDCPTCYAPIECAIPQRATKAALR